MPYLGQFNMRAKLYIFIVFALGLAQLCPAQALVDKFGETESIILPRTNLPGTSFANYLLADSLSKANDSIAAGNALLKISPYYLFLMDESPESLNFFFQKFKFTAKAKNAYRVTFKKVFDSARSESYTRFKEMYEETRQLKDALDAGYSSEKPAYEAKLKRTDSVHFAYLLSYVSTNGWPSMANGSLYAGNIAMRDIEHVYDYMPAAYKAFQAGQLSLSIIRQMNELRRYYEGYVTTTGYIKGHYIKYNVTTMLEGELPTFISDIYRDVKKGCPLNDVFYVLETTQKPTEISPNDWMKKRGSHFEDKLKYFHDKIFENCSSMKEGQRKVITTYMLPTDYKGERLFMYIALRR